MKVGINAYAYGSRYGGIESYSRALITALGTVDPDGDYVLFHGEPIPRDAIPGAEHMRRVVVYGHGIPIPVPYWDGGLTFTKVRAQVGLISAAVAREQLDVIHAQDAAPLLFGAPLVVTLHDAIIERYPQLVDPATLTRRRVRIPLTLRRAAAVLTVSEHAKNDIVRRYCVPPEKVTVAMGGPDPMFRRIHDPARLKEIRERYRTGEHYILFAGTLEQRKNLHTLIEAYVRLRRADTIRHKLVIVGQKAWLVNDIFAQVRESGYADDVVFTGFKFGDDLVALYNAADLFVFPSLAESFGLPPMEAMVCGTPVVCSNTTSFPEVFGDAALTVNPLDVDGLAKAIVTALDDIDLRARLVEKGFQRAARYSWDSAARTIIGVYQNVAQSRHQSVSRRLWNSA